MMLAVFVVYLVAVRVLYGAQVDAGEYCPQRCQCSGSQVINIVCSVDDNLFDVEEIAYQISVGFPKSEISVHIRCPKKNTIVWDNVSNFRDIRTLSVLNCTVNTRAEKIIFLESLQIESLTFDEMDSDFINKLDLRNLKNVTSLTFKKCNLAKIPETIIPKDTSKLSRLSFRMNNIISIDCFLFKNREYPEHATLEFSYNNIHSLPGCICERRNEFYSIKILNNQLSNVSSFRCLNQRHIDIQSNSVEELSPLEYERTVTLDASFNKIKYVRRHTFENLKMCASVDLSYNRIEWIETGAFHGMFQLLHLNLNHNRLKEFESVHAPVGSMFNMDITVVGNQLEYPPYHNTNYEPPQLFQTMARDNPYICDCHIKSLIDRLNAEVHLPHPRASFLTTTYSQLSQIFRDRSSYRCSFPKALVNERILNVNMTKQCPVVKNCPFDCVCTKYLSTSKTSVDCSSRALTQLPQNMPNNSIDIDLSNNSITSLDVRNYLIRTTGLNVSYNQISVVDPIAAPLLVNVIYLDVRYNELSNLPRSLEDTLFDKSTSIFLSGNPWKCSCENVWMSEWLNDNNHHLSDNISLQCLNDANETLRIMDLNEDKLHCNPRSASLATLSIFLGIFAFTVVVLAVVLYKYRYEARVIFYTRIKARFGSTTVQDKQFDAFISYSEHDRDFVKQIVNRLEKELPVAYKICIHDRDFTVGSPIAENISTAINQSCVVIFVVSNHFSESDWCSFEFQTSYQTMLVHEYPKLIIIKVGEIDEEQLDHNLKAYFRTKSFIDVDDGLFWDKLIYSLPHQ